MKIKNSGLSSITTGLILFFTPHLNLQAQWLPNWYPSGSGFGAPYDAQPVAADAAPWAQGGNYVNSSVSSSPNNYVCGTADGSPFALVAGGAELIYLDLQQRVAIGWGHTPQVNDCVLDIKGSNSEFRIYGDADGNIESSGNIKLHFGSQSASTNGVFEIIEGIPNGSSNLARLRISPSGEIDHFNNTKIHGNTYTYGRMVIAPLGFGGYNLSTRLSLDARTTDGLHIETNNGKNALWVVNGAGVNRFRVWVNTGGGEDTKMHMAGAAQFGFTGHVSNTMLDNNCRINLDASGMEGLKVTTNNSGNKMIYVNNSGSNTFEVKGNGATYIGSSRPHVSGVCSNAMLTVDGQILARDIRVAIATGTHWADYVFEKNYKPMPLNEVEAYVKKHKHLPEIPSEKEIKEQGLDVTEMNVLLLKKIEELTLYVIELKKESEELKLITVSLDKKQNK